MLMDTQVLRAGGLPARCVSLYARTMFWYDKTGIVTSNLILCIPTRLGAPLWECHSVRIPFRKRVS